MNFQYKMQRMFETLFVKMCPLVLYKLHKKPKYCLPDVRYHIFVLRADQLNPSWRNESGFYITSLKYKEGKFTHSHCNKGT